MQGTEWASKRIEHQESHSVILASLNATICHQALQRSALVWGSLMGFFELYYPAEDQFVLFQ
jgi:hypothetical protein